MFRVREILTWKMGVRRTKTFKIRKLCTRKIAKIEILNFIKLAINISKTEIYRIKKTIFKFQISTAAIATSSVFQWL
jgi:hypothetical protein